MQVPKTFDLITMGRAMVDVYGDQFGCGLEDVSTFSKYVGGCPANIAIGASRLGLKVGMITRVGDEPNGRFLIQQLAREGVDTRHVVTDPQRLTGLAFLGLRSRTSFPLLHYRDDCADLAIAPEDYTDEYLESAKALLVSGSHLINQAALDNLAGAVRRARAVGTKVIFDIDYRPQFWGLVGRGGGESRYVRADRVTEIIAGILPHCDLIVGTEEEIHIAGGSTDAIEALRRIRGLTSAPIVMKRGAKGCVVFPDAIPDTEDGAVVGEGFAVDVFNVVGAGDGFLSGFLFGWLKDRPWIECCRTGNACGALVVSRHGCSPASPTRAELEWFLRERNGRSDLHRSIELQLLHRATTRRPRPGRIFVMACDHEGPFEKLPSIEGRDVAGFKKLVAEAAMQIAGRSGEIGVLFDDANGEEALLAIGSDIGWVGRKVEVTGAVPLKFRGDADPAALLSRWPQHQVVKCLVPIVAEPDAAIQEERLRQLQSACHLYGHELLLELVRDASEEGLAQVGDEIGSLQKKGICPDWWKLPAFSDPGAWSYLEDIILRSNPHCRGILLLGAGRDPEVLRNAFAAVEGHSLVKGFAIGRTLLLDPAREWLSGGINDEALRSRLIQDFSMLTSAWPAERLVA